MKTSEYPYYIAMLNQWLIIKQEGKSLEGYLLDHGYLKIAIYGMGVYGRHLVRELLGGKIQIVFAIDRKVMPPYLGVEVKGLNDALPEVDAVVNSVICSKEEIANCISKRMDVPIIGLDDLVFESY